MVWVLVVSTSPRLKKIGGGRGPTGKQPATVIDGDGDAFAGLEDAGMAPLARNCTVWLKPAGVVFES